MSGESIQKKLYKAYGKVGKKLGTSAQFNVYRLGNELATPTLDVYWLGTVPCAVSADDSFNSALEDEVKLWVNGNYTNREQIQIGDFLKDNSSGKIFYVTQKDLNCPLMAHQLYDTVTFYRSSAQIVSGDFEQVEEVLVEQYPVHIVRSGGGAGGIFPSSTHNSEGLQSGTIMTFAPYGTIQTEDFVVDQFGVRMKITSVQWSREGVVLTAAEVQPNA